MELDETNKAHVINGGFGLLLYLPGRTTSAGTDFQKPRRQVGSRRFQRCARPPASNDRLRSVETAAAVV
jgi:hypothetical protein